MQFPYVCSDFLERCGAWDVCHICLQPRKVHPSDADSGYWAAWLVDELHLLLGADLHED